MKGNNQKLKSHYLTHLRQKNLTDGTIRGYKRHLEKFEAFLGSKPLKKITAQDVDEFVADLKDHVQKQTVQKYVTSLSIFYGWLHHSGKTVKDLTKLLPKFKIPRRVLKDVPTLSQVRRLILTPDINSPKGYRDRTMIIVTYAGGLRRSELLGLKLGSVNTMKQTIIVERKGGAYQEIPIGALAMEYLSTFIDEIRESFSPSGDFVFPNNRGDVMSTESYGLNFRKYCYMNQMEQLTPHSLRHAAATHMMNRGAELRAVQEFLGHRHIVSTEVYTRVNSVDVRKCVDRML